MSDNFLHTMYQSDEEEVAKPVSDVMPERGIMNMPAMSAAIRRMEKTIADLAKTVEEQRRDIKRQDQRIRQLINAQRGLSGELRDVQNDMDNKISLRDFD